MLIGQVRRYGRDLRVALDGRIGASTDLVGLVDADRWEWTIAEAIADLIGPDRVERDEEVAARESFVVVQMGLFGRSRVFGELDAIDTAITLSALDQRAAKDAKTRRADSCDQSAGTGRTTAGRRGRRVSRAQRRAKALVGLAGDSLAGHSCDGRTVAAKPLMVVHVPLDRLTASASGLIDVAVPGWLPTLSGRLVDTLAADADVKAVLFDGARPLMVTRKLRATDIPADTRLACQARDMGGRDPAGRTPIGLSHLHHLDPHHHTKTTTATTTATTITRPIKKTVRATSGCMTPTGWSTSHPEATTASSTATAGPDSWTPPTAR